MSDPKSLSSSTPKKAWEIPCLRAVSPGSGPEAYFDRPLNDPNDELMLRGLFQSAQTTFGIPLNHIVLLVFNPVQRMLKLFTTDSSDYDDDASLTLSESQGGNFSAIVLSKDMPPVGGRMQIGHSIGGYGSNSKKVKISFGRPVGVDGRSVIDVKFLNFSLIARECTR